MKSSNKQRRAQLQRQRLARAQNWPTRLAQAANAQEARALIAQAARQGVGVALADQAVLARHCLASPVAGKQAQQWLCWRLERQQCLQTPPATVPARKKHRGG
ncbi:hypothetical protein [Vandammella animalimorsus]|uniref:hypothetical protein n=1 Tax=Vandammella animalimorsus TaxID=2029117 RepID=UPI000BAA7D2F|nr:hypothetical protein [Vandammella animalimorsus]PAT30917.1 hypothetical protein CK626_12820 [Vandammella animalimorsus]